MKSNYKKLLVLISAALVFLVIVIIKVASPEKPKAANFTAASATLGNSRFSFVAGIDTGTSGSSNVTIDTSGNPDKDVDHLFPKDNVCFAPASKSGCTGDKYYTVASTEGADGDQFTLTTALTNTLNATDLAIASASGSLVISVTLATAIPDGGDLLITIPMATDADGNDGLPDYAATVAASGFDLNGIAAGDISVATSTSGTCNNSHWTTTETITEGSGSSDHTIRIDRSGSECEANSTILTITIDSSPGIVNPAPINTSRTQGVADAYTINIKSRDNTDATIDTSDLMVAPVEGVLVSATVEETLAFTVAGEAAAGSKCGLTTDVTTTATSVPWGSISSPNSFLEASQVLTLSTNADGGYSVTIQENDQMGKDGVTCTGTAPSSGNFTFSGATCIRDTVCSASTCSESTGYNWTDASTYPGLGYTLENVDGTDASFVYNSNDPCTTSAGAGSFCARQIADSDQGSETAQTIMTNADPVDSKDIRVCYRITVPGTQPAGYYYNKVRYTATPVF